MDLLWPPHCAGCGGPLPQPVEPPLCRACRAHLLPQAKPWCGRCGAPVLGGRPCVADHRWLLGLCFARAPFAYVGTGGALVRRLKFAAEFAAAMLLAAAMARALGDVLPRGFRRALLVPVPLHRSRRRARGFDQAALLAQELAARTGLEWARRLSRRRPTLPQGDPRVTSRERNVTGAFSLRRRPSLRGQRVVLVDDVTTSGATARVCAALLRAAGAVEVGLVTACRA